ncbi:unnamed protein product [Citrullus colocynthis]|uniref:Uncharacterized protein n=1 Tax=Citrullus colocynthis TaxID=252529 RepID=A0ABP0ZAH7_9ROSI
MLEADAILNATLDDAQFMKSKHFITHRTNQNRLFILSQINFFFISCTKNTFRLRLTNLKIQICKIHFNPFLHLIPSPVFAKKLVQNRSISIVLGTIPEF